MTLGELLPAITTPVRLLNGKNDPAVPVSNVEYPHSRLQGSKLDVIDTSHFVWEENAAEYARVITEWWKAN